MEGRSSEDSTEITLYYFNSEEYIREAIQNRNPEASDVAQPIPEIMIYPTESEPVETPEGNFRPLPLAIEVNTRPSTSISCPSLSSIVRPQAVVPNISEHQNLDQHTPSTPSPNTSNLSLNLHEASSPFRVHTPLSPLYRVASALNIQSEKINQSSLTKALSSSLPVATSVAYFKNVSNALNRQQKYLSLNIKDNLKTSSTSLNVSPSSSDASASNIQIDEDERSSITDKDSLEISLSINNSNVSTPESNVSGTLNVENKDKHKD